MSEITFICRSKKGGRLVAARKNRLLSGVFAGAICLKLEAWFVVLLAFAVKNTRHIYTGIN